MIAVLRTKIARVLLLWCIGVTISLLFFSHLSRNSSKPDIRFARIVDSGNQYEEVVTTQSHINEVRLHAIQKICETEKYIASLPPASRMYDIPALNISLTLIAKVASTSWVTFLSRHVAPECITVLDAPRFVRLHECVKVALSSVTTPRHLKVRAVFVRDPWQRLISVYEDKIKKQRCFQARNCYARWNITREDNSESSTNLSLKQFVTCIIETASKDPEDLDPHWRPQYLMHGPCTSHYTHLGNLETLRADFIYLMKSAMPGRSVEDLSRMFTQFSGGPRRPWELSGLTKRKQQYLDYYKTLSPQQIAGLQTIYKWDTVLYNYSLDPLSV